MKRRIERGDAASIELRVRSYGDHDGRVHIFIDGRDLIELVRDIELAEADDDLQRKLAGAYGGLQPWEWADLPEQRSDGRAAVLGCTCGVAGCWPLRARIDVRDSTVIWSDFEGPGGESYEALGRFIFRREQYEAAVAAILPGRA